MTRSVWRQLEWLQHLTLFYLVRGVLDVTQWEQAVADALQRLDQAAGRAALHHETTLLADFRKRFLQEITCYKHGYFPNDLFPMGRNLYSLFLDLTNDSVYASTFIGPWLRVYERLVVLRYQEPRWFLADKTTQSLWDEIEALAQLTFATLEGKLPYDTKAVDARIQTVECLLEGREMVKAADEEEKLAPTNDYAASVSGAVTSLLHFSSQKVMGLYTRVKDFTTQKKTPPAPQPDARPSASLMHFL